MNTYQNHDSVSIKDLLQHAFEEGSSDLHINVGTDPLMRKNGRLVKAADRVLMPVETERMAKELLSDDQFRELMDKGEVDFSFALPGYCRFRANVYKQKRVVNMAFRVLSSNVPSFHSLGLPDVVKDFTTKRQGLVLVTGPTGSGKSTTLASMIDLINETSRKHIITLEDPIEYIHRSKNGLIAQREIGKDTQSFSTGLRAALRQDPDVILVGEMRDLETIQIAITAAETGHLVFATLHTPDAPQTVDRIIDVFSMEQQRQVRIQLASVLIGIVSQRLVTRIDDSGRSLAMEILVNNPAVANLIRNEKIYQIKSVMQTSRHLGMQTMAHSLRELVNQGMIHPNVLREYESTIGEEVR